MKHQPERTCIGCRAALTKQELVRIVAGPDGPIIDYRGKMQGRAAYVCPDRDCIAKASSRENLSRSLHVKISPARAETIIELLAFSIKEKIKSLVSMSVKAGKAASGYSAVLDALEKNRAEVILCAADISEGTREKVLDKATGIPQFTVFTRDEMGRMFNREFVGVIAIEDKGFADAVLKESERLKSLIKINQ